MIVKAFPAIRPASEYAALVAALPYDVINYDEARELAQGNPYSFLHVDRAEIDLEKEADPYEDRVYQQAGASLTQMWEEGIFLKEDHACFYLYRLSQEGRTQTGLVSCVSIDDYLEGKIKKHEMTREEKEKDRIRHVDVCNAHTGPVLLTYRARADIDALTASGWENLIEPRQALYAFTAEDGVRHEVRRIDDAEILQKLIKAFSQVDSFYIADGHHRMSAAAQVGLMRRRAQPDHSGEEGFNHCLAVLFPDNQMHIMAYNRLVRDLNGFSADEFLEKINKAVRAEPLTGRECPIERRCINMYLSGKWYKLTMPNGAIPDDPVEGLDVSLLQKRILQPILGIRDPRRDQRIDFVGGIRGLNELERRVDSGEMAVAFALYPVSINELFKVSDRGEMMPPKSTWFEPKLRSGLFIHMLDELIDEDTTGT